jgi:hypothetical protein
VREIKIVADRTKNVLFVASYWDSPGHVGVLRAQRMVKWLEQSGFHITVVRAGSRDHQADTSFGKVITIADPLKMHPDVGPDHVPIAPRKANRFRRWMAYALLVPDPAVLWTRRITRHPLVVKHAKSCAWFLASCPPESGFLAASALADRFDGRFIMDMRDGWLDEPMKPLLQRHKWQQWREMRLEKRLIMRANAVTVTSEVWKKLLVHRYPDMGTKITVLPNAYPEYDFLIHAEAVTSNERRHKPESATCSSDDNPEKPFVFLYSGRLFSSRPGRQIDQLIRPLMAAWHRAPFIAEFVFAGELTIQEEAVLAYWESKFSKFRWKLTRIAQESHEQALRRMQQADLLLLLSASMGSIPAKFFDYVASGTPILASSPKNSALDFAGQRLRQYYAIYPEPPYKGTTPLDIVQHDSMEIETPYDHPQNDTSHENCQISDARIDQMLFHLKHGNQPCDFPAEFRESHQKSCFLNLFIL